jgi:hypothetical protein
MKSATATFYEGEKADLQVSLSGDIATSTENKGTFAREPVITEGSVSRLRKLYEFRGGLIVERFLRDNPYLNVLLLEAHEEIREHFDLGTRTALEVVADPEAQEDRQLFVVIRTKFPPKVARALLAELDRDWWLGALPRTQGKMELTIERV